MEGHAWVHATTSYLVFLVGPPATVDVGFGVALGPFRAEASFRLQENEHFQVLDLGLDRGLTLGQNLLGPLFVDQNQGPCQVWDHALTEDLLLEEGP